MDLNDVEMIVRQRDSGRRLADDQIIGIAEDVMEKLRKGRLWKRHCRITHLNRIMGKDAPGTELTDDAGDTIYALILGQWLGSDGQCVTLTMDAQ